LNDGSHTRPPAFSDSFTRNALRIHSRLIDFGQMPAESAPHLAAAGAADIRALNTFADTDVR
jgi:hypothetical protein